ncbi:MAG: hypothetical protein JOY71_12325 [Acetobacteraceae bacterium]|nr:hypothetical protein [Acetobacteraceae bacterium]MBV8522886.1 hypothetical protein [Acetobacteraceae bacterium]
MSLEPVSRRTVVTSGAVLSGLALAAGWPRAHAAPATGEVLPPASGLLALWTQIADGGAVFRLAQLDPTSHPAYELANAAISADQVVSVAEVHARARSFVIAAVARSWGVPPGVCCCSGSTISHPESGRSVCYIGWTDFV